MSGATKGPRVKYGTTPRHYVVVRAIMASRLTSSEKHVLHAIEGHVSYRDRNTGRAYPSWATLAEATGLGRSTVAQLLGRLEEAGWLEVVRRSVDGEQVTNVYRVTPPMDHVSPTGVQPMDPHGVQPMDGGGPLDIERGVQPMDPII